MQEVYFPLYRDFFALGHRQATPFQKQDLEARLVAQEHRSRLENMV